MNTLLYCIEIEVQKKVSEDWLAWMNKEHIPDLLNTGLFSKASLYHDKLRSGDETEVFELQYVTTEAELRTYEEEHADRLRSEHNIRFEGKYDAKRRILQLKHKKEQDG